ncbi:acyl-CoA dehydrogenase family protein [Bacillus sp. B15-48]|uniref:acyl-CoA dehydrogenase family protein n=1 Tax=Bacillus sp. B15-48 TaxID=1548601 RepID=UPI00193F07D6|nr:acyl-CoA dehydrogenase family protein [Bacillus sp. B15-48]MBM4762866.1 acyl-CoA dehydrogenase [Bacillus sp. B15-48]
MDFKLTEEQALIQQSIKEFISEQSGAPVGEILKSLAEIDFMGIFLDEEMGGAGGDFTSYILALEEIAKVSPSAALAFAINSTQVEYALNLFGSLELKNRYLSQLCKGEIFGAYAYSEQGIGEDLLSIDTTVEKNQDSYVLNGSKTFVLGGGENDLYIVFAKGEKGLSAFVVEAEFQGVSFGTPYRKMGLDGVVATTMNLENVIVPIENLVGEEGKAEVIVREVQDVHNISLATIAVGISEAGMDMAIAYGKERQQFRVPVITFEALREKIGEMTTNIEAARLLTYKAAACKDDGESFIETAKMAKYFAIKTGEDNVREAIQIHGGYGYTRDLGVERLFRDMKGLNVIDSVAKPLVIAIADEKIS